MRTLNQLVRMMHTPQITWSSLLIALGGASAISRRFGITPWAVCKWEMKGVPAERVIPLAAATGWQVLPHEIRPDLYPNPTDGVPAKAA